MPERPDRGMETHANGREYGKAPDGRLSPKSALAIVVLTMTVLALTQATANPEILPPPQCLIADVTGHLPAECG